GMGQPTVPQGLQLPMAHQARRVRPGVYVAQVHDRRPRRPADRGSQRRPDVEVDTRCARRDDPLCRPASVLHPL
ncbi:hypothetical protein BN1723_019415, partial [Verticillium longisporum]